MCWDERKEPPCSAFYWLKGVLANVCLGWPWTAILPISASRVARSTDISYHAWFQHNLYRHIRISHLEHR
jgi:hypothetical protein